MSRAIPLIDCAGMSNERWLECRAHGPKGDIPYTVAVMLLPSAGYLPGQLRWSSG